MKISGLQKTSLIDYPGKIASTLFVSNCNFRCPYCYNSDLVFDKNTEDFKKEKIFKILKQRIKFIDGVCITGGEPTLNEDLPEFISEIKKLNLLVKLDTNGTNPKMLEHLIKNKLIDYIAMDIKAPLDKYNKITNSNVDIKKIKESINIIINSGIDHEMRTTILPSLHTKRDIIEIAKTIKSAKRYFIQQFVSNVRLLDPKLEKSKTFTDNELESIKKECNKYIKTEIRK